MNQLDIIYRQYEPDKGLEEIQAKIFNQATGEKATAENIKNRYEKEKTNPRFVRYAYTKDGTPLAYCQARRDDKKSIAIGYPWAVPECPTEVQEKIFDELFGYIKESKPKEISYWLKVTWQKQIDFFKRKGFVKTIQGLQFDFDVNVISQIKIPNEPFYSRLATNDDLNLLVEIAKVDRELKRVFTEEGLRNYFQDKVLKDGHCVLVFKGDLLVCASAPLREWPDKENDDYMIMRFLATRPGYEHALKKLVFEVATECVAIGWTDMPLRIYGDSNTEIATILNELNPEIKPNYVKYVFNEE